jgi:LysR family transcriptional regulator, nitrogen assimilation regulatory protein
MDSPVQASLRDICLFIAAYEEGSFTSAAQRENATQSGVSQHVRNLEQAFGVKLFAREKGRIAPTPAGDNYYRRCIEIIRAHASASSVVKSYATGLDGEIHVGLMPTMTRCTLAPALARFVAAHPNVNIHVVEGYSAMLTHRVRAGDLDFAIVPAFPGSAGLKSRLFLQTPEVLVSAPGSPFTALAPLRLGEVGALKLVLPGKANTRRTTLETYCTTVGAQIERIIELDAMFGTLDFVARGDWVAILPAILMGEGTDPQFKINPIVDPPLSLDLVLIEPARRPLAPAAEIFLKFLEEEAGALARHWQENIALHIARFDVPRAAPDSRIKKADRRHLKK